MPLNHVRSFALRQPHQELAARRQLLQRYALSHGPSLYLPLTTGFLARLVVGDSESGPGAASSQATDSSRVSNFKIMAVRRGFSSEGDLLLDYLEKGVFHALEKQYLKRFILALYLVRSPLLSTLHSHLCLGARLTIPIGQGGSE